MNLKIAVLEDKENDYRILESALKIWSEGSGNRIELFWYQTGNEMLKSFEQDGFDILFSDIELEENGDILERLFFLQLFGSMSFVVTM